jgi:hypothetical protein
MNIPLRRCLLSELPTCIVAVSVQRLNVCELRGLHSGVANDSPLFRFDAASLDKWFPTFRTNVSPLPSRIQGPRRQPQTVKQREHVYTGKITVPRNAEFNVKDGETVDGSRQNFIAVCYKNRQFILWRKIFNNHLYVKSGESKRKLKSSKTDKIEEILMLKQKTKSIMKLSLSPVRISLYKQNQAK